MMPENRFSNELKNISELPEPFAKQMQQHLAPHENLNLLIFKPRETAGTETSPPKALAITSSHFIFAELPDGLSIRSVRCELSTVLLVELATLLLYGHLRIDYVERTIRHTVAMEYNSVSHELYRRAVYLILANAFPACDILKRPEPNNAFDLVSCPAPIRKAAEFAMLPGTPPQEGVWWSSIRSGFGHELAPAGIVLARDNRITIITLEQSGPWDRVRAEPTFGIIATYLPVDRIAKITSHRTPTLTILDLNMHARHGGEVIQLAIPPDREEAVSSLIKNTLSSMVV